MNEATSVTTKPEPSSFLPLPHLAFHVLLALAQGELHGWAIIKRIREITEGVTNPSSGSLYLSMGKLEERGLLEEASTRPSPGDDDTRRRYYRLTPLGRRVVEAEAERLAGLVNLARVANILPPTDRGGR